MPHYYRINLIECSFVSPCMRIPQQSRLPLLLRVASNSDPPVLPSQMLGLWVWVTMMNWSFIIIIIFVCMYMFVCAFMTVCVCVCELNLGFHSPGVFGLVFRPGLLLTGGFVFRLTGPRDLCCSPPSTWNYMPAIRLGCFFSNVDSGFELRSSCLPSIHSTSWAVSQMLSTVF